MSDNVSFIDVFVYASQRSISRTIDTHWRTSIVRKEAPTGCRCSNRAHLEREAEVLKTTTKRLAASWPATILLLHIDSPQRLLAHHVQQLWCLRPPHYGSGEV